MKLCAPNLLRIKKQLFFYSRNNSKQTRVTHRYNLLYIIVALFTLSISTLSILGCNGSALKNDTPATTCATPNGMTLTDIQSVVDWINALEKPLSLPCFIESLPRPLKTHSAISVFSAQPSQGRRSPRVFFFFDKLILTVAVDQDLDKNIPIDMQPQLLEMSHSVDDENAITTKGEIKFPIKETISTATPYSDIAFNQQSTTCSFCHANESVYSYADDVPIYQSSMLKPSVSIPIGELIVENSTCNINTEKQRCETLASIVEHGDLVLANFPENAPTISND